MSKQRMIAIVGRPNVGKSAIYNRLAGRRIAIVHSESGVTRDRLVCKAEWAGQTYQLVDTGGLGTVDDVVGVDAITAGVRNQVEAALADAAVALLVVDVESGVLPLDAAVAGWLRKSGCQTLVVANKADNAERDNHAVDFTELGFPVFPVSALHDRGFPVLMRAALAALPPKGEGAEQGETPADPLRVAIVGRPNVGKSSYINRLLGDARVIVSNVPGTTRDSVDIPFVVGTGPTARHYLLIDTAGVRRKGKIDTLVERFSRMRTEETIARAHVVVLMLDAATGPTTQDKKVAAIIAEHRRGATLFVNKWDLAQATQTKYDPALREALPFLAHCPIVYLSANSGFNIRRSLEAIDQVATQVHAHLPTGILNRVLLDAAERVQPPAIGGKRFKAYYAAQVGRDPIRVRIFANHGAGIPQAYRDFLVRSLREKFGLEGAPVEIQFAERRREPRDGGTRPKRKPLTGAGAAANPNLRSKEPKAIAHSRPLTRGKPLTKAKPQARRRQGGSQARPQGQNRHRR